MPFAQIDRRHSGWVFISGVALVAILIVGCRSFSPPFGLPLKLCVSPNANYRLEASIESIAYAKNGNFTVYATVLATVQTPGEKQEGVPCSAEVVLEIYSDQSRSRMIVSKTARVSERGTMILFASISGAERIYYVIRPFKLPVEPRFACHGAWKQCEGYLNRGEAY